MSGLAHVSSRTLPRELARGVLWRSAYGSLRDSAGTPPRVVPREALVNF